jgi:hypothetical protein
MKLFIPYKPTNKFFAMFRRKAEGFSMPECWEELTPQQFSAVASVIYDNENMSVKELRLLMLQAISGYQRSHKTFTEEQAETINCNLYILSQFIMFPFKMRFTNPELVFNLSNELQSRFKICLPDEIYEPDLMAEIAKYGTLLECKPVYNFNICKNLLPQIVINGNTYQGPIFNIDKHGIIHTDLVAGEWVDACDFASIGHITGLAAVLYRQNRTNYNTSSAQNNIEVFKNATPSELKAVLLMFRAIQQQIASVKNYSVIFREKADDDDQTDNDKITVGASSIIYQLTKDGYGTLEDVTNMPLLDYLNIQVKTLADAVASYRSLGKKTGEISKLLHLDASIIQKL